MANKVKKMSAKDRAFETVKAEYRHKIRELESEIRLKNDAIRMLDEQNQRLVKQHAEDEERWKNMEQFKNLSAHDIEVLLLFARHSYDIINVFRNYNI